MGLFAVIALVLAYGVVAQPVGCNQTAHFSLVEALARGSANIDRFHGQTCDTAYVDGHYYAAKAPGLALEALPFYSLLDAAGSIPRNAALGRGFPDAMLAVSRSALWQVGLWAVVLPAALLLLLVRAVVERIEPGSGTAAAILLGAGTLVLPFATMLFSHLLSTTLAFGAFAVLFAERRARPRPLLLVVAGMLAGLAVTVEYPLLLAAVVLCVYAVARSGWPRRFLAYLGGAAAGVAPLAAFNIWAFGSATHLSYANAVLDPGRSGHDVLGANSAGFFGIGRPSPRDAVELLVSAKGLLTLTPIAAVGFCALLLLYRRRFRAEAIVCGLLPVGYLVYDSGYYLPFGGWVPGPRFLIPALPFLAVPLGLALRRWPVTTVALGVISAAAMTVATAAEPLIPGDNTGSWFDRAARGDFTHTILTFAGLGHGWMAIFPFALFLACAAAACAAATDRINVPHGERLRAPTVVAAWIVLLVAAPPLLRTDRAAGQRWGVLAVLVAGAAISLLLVRLRSHPVAALMAAAPLVFLLVPQGHTHTKWALLAALLSLALALAQGKVQPRLPLANRAKVRVRS